MKLTAHERQQLAAIERRLVADEPRLHRALSRMQGRCLPHPSVIHRLRTGRRWRVLAVLVVLMAGITMLVLGAGMGQGPVMWVGVAVAQFGPLITWWLLVRRRSAAPRSPSHGSPRSPLHASPPRQWKPLLRPDSPVRGFAPPGARRKEPDHG